MSSAQPLVTFLLVAYNQDKFIEEAINGAFLQTYSPLEIFLSDDCSSDNTYQIIQRLADSYQGNNQIVLNRNEENLGLVEHLNHVIPRCKGQLIVLAAGDDISLPNRSEVLACQLANYPNVSAISSRYIAIDTLGRPLEENSERNKVGSSRFVIGSMEVLRQHISFGSYSIAGCTEAIVPQNFLPFTKIPSNTISEDRVFTFQALLTGGIVFLSDQLVMYRSHEGNVFNARKYLGEYSRSAKKREQRDQFVFNNKLEVMRAYFEDLETVRMLALIDADDSQSLLDILNKKSFTLKKQTNWWSSGVFERLAAISCFARWGYWDECKWGFVRLLPHSIFLRLKQYKLNKRKT